MTYSNLDSWKGEVLGDQYGQERLPRGVKGKLALHYRPDLGRVSRARRPGIYRVPSLCQEPYNVNLFSPYFNPGNRHPFLFLTDAEISVITRGQVIEPQGAGKEFKMHKSKVTRPWE